MIKLSVNVNKVATIRNSRGGQLPSVLEATRVCLEAGAPGVTVHPRADARHITERDVREVAALLRDLGGRSEFNIEGDPRPDLLKLFKPAFLGRVTVVPYFPLSDATLRLIIKLQLRRIRDRIADTYRAQFSWNDEVVEAIAARCTEAASGARNIENVLSHGVLPEISSRFLERIAKGEKLRDVQLSLDKDASFSYTIN